MPFTKKKKTPKKASHSSFASRTLKRPAQPVRSSTQPGGRDMLLLTILSTSFLAIIFAAFAKDYTLAMYAMMAITVVASVAMVLVVLLTKE